MTTLRQAYTPEQYSRAGWRHFDYVLILVTLSLMVIGLLMINSATFNSQDADLAGAAKRQALNALVGLAILLLATSIDYRIWQNMRHGLYVIALLFLIATLIFGTGEIGNVGRWLDLKAFPVQPAELAKVLLILALAGFLSARSDQITKFRTVFMSLAYMGVPAFLIFNQPNLSTAVVFIFIWLAMVITAGARPRHLVSLGAAVVLSLPAIWLVMRDYQRDRILSYLDPNHNPGAKYNLDQALISIGSGGWLGQGYSSGSQSQLHFLKVRHTDFIFSVTAEELGFVGAVLVLVLFAVLLYRLIRIADKARDPYGQLVVVSVAAMIFFQAAINIAMNLNLGLVAGLPLPLVSYGGSSLITMLLAIGLAQSVIMRHKKIEF
ncbi:MAG TPA: FtsW/RodA/SpoVE family cell cycle protein [Anaerolineae bacterium]